MVDDIEKRSKSCSAGKSWPKESKGAILDAIDEGQKRLARQRERLAGLLG
jgi:hypothetical protein